MPRGILDTSTLILLGRMHDTDSLPDGPLVRRTSSKPKPISTHCRLTHPQPAASAGSPQGYEEPAASQRHVPTTP